MAITRTVETDVYCDICGEWIMGWKSDDTGVSKTWAAEFARRKGCTVGKKVICKGCRIEKRIQTYSTKIMLYRKEKSTWIKRLRKL